MTSLNQPLLPDVGVLALVYHQWVSPWMTPHHVLSRLGRYFHVVWVNPAHEWREIPARRRLSPVHQDGAGLTSGFRVYIPEFWLPKFYRPKWLDKLTFDQRLRQGLRVLTSQGCRRVILYLWHPQFGQALSSSLFNLRCYHIDDEYSFSNVELPFDKAELQVISAVDQVFIVSPGLLEKKGALNPHTTFVPEGVDYEAYAKPVAEPTDIATVPHPRIGYTGRIKTHLDWTLLLDLTLKHPDWSFVFVGPVAPHTEITDAIAQMTSRRNVYFLGEKSVDELAAYPQHFDVCIMPYKENDYTKYIYPLKLHEYLASGSPVVGSPIRSLQEFSHILRLARTADEWSEAIGSSLAASARSPVQVEARRNVAREHDWGALVRRIAHAMCDRLGPMYLERLEGVPIGTRELAFGKSLALR